MIKLCKKINNITSYNQKGGITAGEINKKQKKSSWIEEILLLITKFLKRKIKL
jgi:hypothetical protein